MRNTDNLYTVADIIKELKKYDQKAIVLVQRDPEGNGIHELIKLEVTREDSYIGGKPSVTFVAGSDFLEPEFE